jgi:hypothetical protein
MEEEEKRKGGEELQDSEGKHIDFVIVFRRADFWSSVSRSDSFEASMHCIGILFPQRKKKKEKKSFRNERRKRRKKKEKPSCRA